MYDAQASTQDLQVLSLNSACIYGKPKNISIFKNFKGIVSSKQPKLSPQSKTITVLLCPHSPFPTMGNKTVLLTFKC